MRCKPCTDAQKDNSRDIVVLVFPIRLGSSSLFIVSTIITSLINITHQPFVLSQGLLRNDHLTVQNMESYRTQDQTKYIIQQPA